MYNHCSTFLAQRCSFRRHLPGLGDMSRGALLLRAVRERRELSYALITAGVAGARRTARR